MSIRWKVALLCILLAVLPIVFLNTYTVRVFDQFTRKMLEEQMIDYAHVIAADYHRQQRSEEHDASFSDRLQHFQQEFGARLRVVNTNGIVEHDSARRQSVGLDVSENTDVKKALQGEYGARTELTDDHSLLFYHIALPIRTADGTVIGAALVQAHTAAITRAILAIVRDYRMAMAVALAIAMLAAVALASTLTRRLRMLTRHVKAFARGDSKLKLSTSGRDEIGELSRAVSSMADEIRDAETRQRDLMASTAHQLKTPLTAIKGAVQILEKRGDQIDARQRFLTNISTSADRLLYMVEQLTALSHLKTEELRGRKTETDYCDFLDEAIKRLYPAPRVPISLNIPDVNIRIAIIPERIEQVLTNLLDNAIRHTDETGEIRVTVKEANSTIETSITDTGDGIEPSDLPRVFEQFFSTVKNNHQGSGLGLAIAQSIIQRHGGTISAESTPGRGSRFTFTLPR
jgi:two-component system sensor histidine kinase BaeS